MIYTNLPTLFAEAEEYGKVNLMTHGCLPDVTYSCNIEFDMKELANLNVWSHGKKDLEEAMREAISKAQVVAERVMRPMPEKDN